MDTVILKNCYYKHTCALQDAKMCATKLNSVMSLHKATDLTINTDVSDEHGIYFTVYYEESNPTMIWNGIGWQDEDILGQVFMYYEGTFEDLLKAIQRAPWAIQEINGLSREPPSPVRCASREELEEHLGEWEEMLNTSQVKRQRTHATFF